MLQKIDFLSGGNNLQNENMWKHFYIIVKMNFWKIFLLYTILGIIVTHAKQNQPHYFDYLGNEEVYYLNNLPLEWRMVEITYNIWGTKFKINDLAIILSPLHGQFNSSISADLMKICPIQKSW